MLLEANNDLDEQNELIRQMFGCDKSVYDTALAIFDVFLSFFRYISLEKLLEPLQNSERLERKHYRKNQILELIQSQSAFLLSNNSTRNCAPSPLEKRYQKKAFVRNG